MNKVKKVLINIPPNIVHPTANLIPSPAPGPMFPTIKGTWAQYKKETKNKYATRARFKDYVDYIGSYLSKKQK